MSTEQIEAAANQFFLDYPNEQRINHWSFKKGMKAEYEKMYREEQMLEAMGTAYAMGLENISIAQSLKESKAYLGILKKTKERK